MPRSLSLDRSAFMAVQSTGTVYTTRGEVCHEAVIFAAMFLRRLFTLTGGNSLSSVCPSSPLAAASTSAFITRSCMPIAAVSTPSSAASLAAIGLTLAADFSAPAGRNFSTSSSVIRPLGPVPSTRARSTSFSFASFFAAGDAITGSPLRRTGTCRTAA